MMIVKTRFNNVSVELTFNASDNEKAPESPIQLVIEKRNEIECN